MSRYKFKSYTITNCGYYKPDHYVWWEEVNDNGEACFYGNTLREVEFQILDYEWEQKMKKKDEEIEKLKREKIEVEADALAVGGIVETERHKPVGNAHVCGDADYIVFKNSWSSMRWFTYTRSNRKWKVGCFYGTGDELVKKAYADSEKSGRCYEAIVRAVEAIETAMTK